MILENRVPGSYMFGKHGTLFLLLTVELKIFIVPEES